MLELLSFPVVVIIFTTSTVLLVSWDWRASLSSLAMQYIGVFVLVSVSWSVEIAMVKLVAGIISCVVLGLALRNLSREYILQDRYAGSEIVFRVVAALLAGLIVITTGPILMKWFGELTIEQAYGALILITLGLIQLGLTIRPLNVVIGLLTVLSGFGILYAAIESSVLIMGFLAVITLGMSVVGAYLLTAPTLEETS
jgi:hypothetical protein